MEPQDNIFDLLSMAMKDACFKKKLDTNQRLQQAFANHMLFFYHGKEFDENVLKEEIISEIRIGLLNGADFAIAQKKRLRRNAHCIDHDSLGRIGNVVDDALKSSSNFLKAFRKHCKMLKAKKKEVDWIRKLPNDERMDPPITRGVPDPVYSDDSDSDSDGEA